MCCLYGLFICDLIFLVQDLVFEMALSPNGLLLATLDCEGKLEIRRLPSLVRYSQWTFQDQVRLQYVCLLICSFIFVYCQYTSLIQSA